MTSHNADTRVWWQRQACTQAHTCSAPRPARRPRRHATHPLGCSETLAHSSSMTNGPAERSTCPSSSCAHRHHHPASSGRPSTGWDTLQSNVAFRRGNLCKKKKQQTSGAQRRFGHVRPLRFCRRLLHLSPMRGAAVAAPRDSRRGTKENEAPGAVVRVRSKSAPSTGGRLHVRARFALRVVLLYTSS